MDSSEFVKSTVYSLQPDIFEQLKTVLLPEYLSFFIIDEDGITKEILSEKLCDYFEKLELKTVRKFYRFLESYFQNLDDITERRIEKAPQPKKNDSTPMIVPRARKYYEKAASLKKASLKKPKDISMRNLVDYTRIMLCLYTAIVKNGFKEIDNFDFASDCLDPVAIIGAMKNEQEPVAIKIGTKKKFDIREPYCSDTCTFILVILLAYKILNDSAQGGADNE